MSVRRRTLLGGLGAQIGAASVGCASAHDSTPPTPAPSRPSPDVVVIGAGAFGGWTALHLQRLGARVRLIDAYGPGNPRATSGGLTRQIRASYGRREHYTRWAQEALVRWEAFEREVGESLLVRTGRLAFANRWTEALRANREVLERHGIPIHVLEPREVRERFPQVSTRGLEFAIYEPTVGTLRAREACRAVVRQLEREGGVFEIAKAAPGPSSNGRLEGVNIGRETLASGQFVFACGPWLARLFPEVVRPILSTPRRDVFFFGPPPGDPRFSHPHLPNFTEGEHNIYGFCDLDALGLKVCPIGGPADFDSDGGDRRPSAEFADRARAYLALRFPDMARQPIVHSRVCQLEDTPDEHFLVDRHPAWQNVWIAGGGTGHAFKHGPVLGEYIARRVLGDGRPEDREMDDRFGLIRTGAKPDDQHP